MLTRKQLDLLEFIHKRMQRDGVPPSFDEMKDALDLRSKSGIHRLITALEERGFIRRLAHRARAIEIVKLPEALDKGQTFVPRVIEGDKRDEPEAATPPGRCLSRRMRWNCLLWAGSPPVCRLKQSARSATTSQCRARC